MKMSTISMMAYRTLAAISPPRCSCKTQYNIIIANYYASAFSSWRSCSGSVQQLFGHSSSIVTRRKFVSSASASVRENGLPTFVASRRPRRPNLGAFSSTGSTASACPSSSSSSTSLIDEESDSKEPLSSDDNDMPPTSDSPFFSIYYNDVFHVDLPPGHRFPMEKYRKVRKAVQEKVSNLSDEERGRVYCEFKESPLATREQVITTHDAHYVQRYLTGQMTDLENRNIGFPWSLQHVNRTLSSVGGTVAAACSAWEEYVRRYNYIHHGQEIYGDTNRIRFQHLNKNNMHLCWGAHVAGGTHHAFSDYGEGFCIFSDIAVAANVLLQRYSSSSMRREQNKFGFAQQNKDNSSTSNRQNYPISPSVNRILIIDLDVHQGNGNAALFDGNENVLTFSMHCSGNYFSKKERSDLDVELPIGCGDETYLTSLNHWLKQIERYHTQDDDVRNETPFDVIFFQAGVDIHVEDRLGRLSVSAAGISKRNSLVFDFANRMKAPLVICMGGGYPRKDWTPILDAHTSVYWEAHQYLSSFGGTNK